MVHSGPSDLSWRDKPQRPQAKAEPVTSTTTAVTAATEGVFRAVDPTAEFPLRLNIPPRRMWGWGARGAGGGNGFCGECSLQTALLFFGSYVSQERVRYAAGNHELLLGVHDRAAAKALHLKYAAFDNDNHEDPQCGAFLQWTARQLAAGTPVIAAWFLRTLTGDADYDHIMPVVGAAVTPFKDPRKRAKAPLKMAACGVAALEFHDLARPAAQRAPSDEHRLVATRAELAGEQPTVAEEYQYALPRVTSYGLAVSGVNDPKRECRRVMLHTDRWDEPDWGAEDGVDAAVAAIGLSATVLGLTEGATYALLRFDGVDGVPPSGFLASGAWSRRIDFVAVAAAVHLVAFDSVPSDGAFFYRVVAIPSE
jgi:hypothetical protein